MTDVETVIAARDIAVAAVTTTAANVDLATQQADRAEVARDAAVAPTAAQIAAVDADAGSAFRVQQDARLTNTFAAALHIKPGSQGVVGNGTGNDTAAIQAILDGVSTSLGVTTVVVHAGTYMVNGVSTGQAETRNNWIGGGLRPKAGTTLLLAPDAILKVITNSSPGYACIYLARDHDNVTIKGGQILGDRATHDYLTEPTYTTHEFGYGIVTHGATDVTIEGVSISGCTGDSIYVAPEGLIGISPYYPSERITIRDNILDAPRRNNISVLGGDHILIENNLIKRAGFDDGIKAGTAPKFGIDLEGYGEGSVDYEIPTRITVRGNKFVGNVSGAVMNFDGYEVVLDGNWSDGIFSYGSGTETVITNNVLVNTADTTSVAIGGNTATALNANALISGNIIKGFGTGIGVRNQSVSVVGNLVTGFTVAGISVNTNALGASVSGNNVREGAAATSIGVAVSATTGAFVADNLIYNVRQGVLVDTSSTKVNVRGNQITKCYQGVKVSGACQVTISGNVIDIPGHSAGETYNVQWDGTSIVVFQGNEVRNSVSYPINATNATNGRSRIIGNTFADITNSLSLTGGRHEVIGNTFIGYKTSGSFTTGTLILSGGDKHLVMENVTYHSGTVAYGYMVRIDTATNSRVVGNQFVGTAILGGTPTGGEVVTDNNVIAA